MFDVLIIWGSFFIAGLVFSIWEAIQPARAINYRPELLRDVGAFLTVFSFFLAVGALVQVLQPVLISPTLTDIAAGFGLLAQPVWIRLIIFYLIWDFSLYWVHWFMHTDILWPVHKWHHAPPAVWWFVGVRGSLPHIFLTYFPFLWFWILGLPAWLAVIVSIDAVVRNAWMHVNVTGQWMRWVELVFVTPRFHAIHHSDNAQHYRANLGSLLTIWDRMFGTYVDPEKVNASQIQFGIGEKIHPIRLAIGF
jgi:sterol desaturase/sphingolipid hydroxylase (fatty acid hydroxylase superfamily)